VKTIPPGTVRKTIDNPDQKTGPFHSNVVAHCVRGHVNADFSFTRVIRGPQAPLKRFEYYKEAVFLLNSMSVVRTKLILRMPYVSSMSSWFRLKSVWI